MSSQSAERAVRLWAFIGQLVFMLVVRMLVGPGTFELSTSCLLVSVSYFFWSFCHASHLLNCNQSSSKRRETLSYVLGLA